MSGPLPPGWEERFDENHKRHYYVNASIRATTWYDPRKHPHGGAYTPQYTSSYTAPTTPAYTPQYTSSYTAPTTPAPNAPNIIVVHQQREKKPSKPTSGSSSKPHISGTAALVGTQIGAAVLNTALTGKPNGNPLITAIGKIAADALHNKGNANNNAEKGNDEQGNAKQANATPGPTNPYQAYMAQYKKYLQQMQQLQHSGHGHGASHFPNAFGGFNFNNATDSSSGFDFSNLGNDFSNFSNMFGGGGGMNFSGGGMDFSGVYFGHVT
ncbi:13687_t:CDS:2 [Ambispora leptoticha]|uniref:13687_t:CDS:1 n=1 Tax=Ambispora leptoticha TaxID=144679 RepID=A0A9N8WAL7_9GLOM|nr:13687_t:CDS:2 [Ambispora leptoticha]